MLFVEFCLVYLNETLIFVFSTDIFILILPSIIELSRLYLLKSCFGSDVF